MAESRPPHQGPATGRTNLASCIVAAIFLTFLIIMALIVYFTIVRPQNPEVTVIAVQVPAFSAGNSTVSFIFSQYVSVNNRNRAVFTHYGGTLQLLHGGLQVGFMYIPSGKIDAGKTQFVTAMFAVQPLPLSVFAGGQPESVAPTVTGEFGGFRIGPSLEVESRIDMAGQVRILHIFTHNVDARAHCRVSLSAGDGTVLGFHCSDG
ncbi:hypothetical protein OROGR_012939 [Orobanche gracilis]